MFFIRGEGFLSLVGVEEGFDDLFGGMCFWILYFFYFSQVKYIYVFI